jgi:Carboxypeptidase regulatory-like domain
LLFQRFIVSFFFCSGILSAQSMGRAGTINGTITDPSGGAVAGATVDIKNAVSGYSRTTAADSAGAFKFADLPPNSYRVTVTAGGFQTFQQDVSIRNSVPVALPVVLKIGANATSIDVTTDIGDVLENVPVSKVDIDSSTFSKLPTSSTSGLSDAITLATPGVVADSNGFFHPIGDHAETGFSVDNQPVTDQQSKLFSTAMPLNAFQSMEVIAGAPPAEYGDKTSLVVNAITKSGLGATKSYGSITAQYGSYGTYGENYDWGIGTAKFGNFLVANNVRSGRYLDSPEFSPLHDRGNNETYFDRLDYQPTELDSIHLNLFFSRAWFQTPNTYDQQTAGQDQRQQIRTFNIAPGWVHTFGASTSLTVNPYFRHDEVQYFPSRNIDSDVPATLSQLRTLGNLGIRADLSSVHGIHNIKAGVQVQHFFLTEGFNLGITDPTANPICLTSEGDPVTNPKYLTPASCATGGYVVNPNLQPGLVPYDLSRGGQLFNFRGHTDIKEEAYYIEDSINFKNLGIQAGLRADTYFGLVSQYGIQPRIGTSYQVKKTGTVLRLAYSRFFETPYNEGLILSSSTGSGGLASNPFGAYGSTPLVPGRRDQYNAGFQQTITKRILVDVSYIWKYTHNAFDFDTLLNTPITFPIEWRKSKIDGLSSKITFTETKGFSAYVVLGHTRARFFGPENGGLLFNSPLDTGVFRIDHDQAFQQTTNLRYQYKKNGPWINFTWRYDSGEVAGSVATLADAYALSGDEQAAIGFHCGSIYATISAPITSCAGLAAATLVKIPAPGTENNDHNPPRVAPRNLFDVGVGVDNLFHTERPRYTLRLTAVNITNKDALYNFLSTFSGTHFVAPRSYTLEMGMVW